MRFGWRHVVVAGAVAVGLWMGAPLLVPHGAGGGSLADTAVVTAITRDAGSTAGGTSFDLRGYKIDPGATVTVGGVSAIGLTWRNSTRITVVTPAGTVGAKDVVLSQNGLTTTLAGAFEYLPLDSQVFAQSSFTNGNTLNPFTVIGNVALSTDFAEPGGTQSAKAIASGNSTAESSLQFTMPADSLSFLAPRGVYFHFYVLIPDTTFAQITGQVKLTLCRDNNAASGEWGHLGVGSQVASSPVGTDTVTPRGLGIVNTPGGANYLPGGHPGMYFRNNRWMEVLIAMKRTSGVSGRIRTWQSMGPGLLKLVTVNGSDTDPANGLDSTVSVYQYRLGAVFNQGNVSATNNLLVYLGDLFYGDGVPNGF